MESETLWERIKQGILESASTAAGKAEHFGKVGRARLDIAETRHAIRDALSELGGAVYSRLKQDSDTAVGRQEDVQGLIQKVGELEGVLQEREDRLQALKDGGGAESKADKADKASK